MTVAGCSGTVAAPSASAAPVKISSNAIVANGVFAWLTQDQGIFAKHGVAVDLQGFNAGQAAMNSLVAGELDGAVYPGPQLILSAQASGTDLKVVAELQTVYDFMLVVPNDVTSPEQLKGKKLGSTTTTSISTESAERLLHRSGLEAGKDYQFVSTGTTSGQATTVAALIAHEVDFATLAPDFANQVTSKGGHHVLVDLVKVDLPVAAQSLVFRASYVQQHADVVQKVVDGLIEGVQFLKTHKTETEAMLKSRYQIDDQAALDATYNREVELLTNDPLPDKTQFAEEAAFADKSGPQITDATIAAVVEPRFVQAAEKRGLTK